MKQPVMLYIDSKLMHGIGIVRYVEWSAEQVNLDRVFKADTIEAKCEMTLASWADREDDVDPAERWQMTAAEVFRQRFLAMARDL